MIASGGIHVDPNAPLLPTLILVAFLFACSFFFSGTETALFSLQAIDRQHMAGGGRLGKLVARLLGRRAMTLTTILMGNEFANTALATTTTSLVIRYFPDHPWLNVVFLTPALVLISEITPKYVAFRTNRAWALLAAGPLTAFALVVSPFRWVFERIVIALAKMFRADPLVITEGLEEAELLVLVDRGAATGALDQVERDIIENVFELDAMPVDRLMTPKPDMFSVPVEIGFDELIELCREERLSRVPVFDKGRDDIVGVLLLKDLLRVRDDVKRRSSKRWLYPLLLPPRFVPASKPADDMFREFIRRKYHMAFVVDEHGTLVGLVTLDDLVNELLGASEPDTADSEIASPRANRFVCKATVDLEDFEETTGITVPEGDYHTLGGYVFHAFGRLPKQGESVEQDGVRYIVSEMDDRRIAEVRVEILAQSSREAM
ncbi:MAG: HlyC/CorC family transporter [Alphaproteobacteria bacterium]|nr:HlyC/CorC family transporter [Alphaproteobacteria bacterium]